jgi:PAS domain S-box-containing protein
MKKQKVTKVAKALPEPKAQETPGERRKAEAGLFSNIALQSAIFNSANFSSIATDAQGVIQIFNVGAERMLGYAAADVMNKMTPADISDPKEVIARAKALSAELDTPITPGFEALVFKASRGIEDIYELTYIRKDGSRFSAVVSVTALRDAQDGIIGYLLIGTDNTARKLIEEEKMKLDQRLRDQQFYTRSLIESNIDAIMTTDPAGIITDVNKQMEALTECTRDELIGAPLKKYFSDPDLVVAVMNSVLNGKKITNYDLTVRARSGKETAIAYSATTFHDRDRLLQGVFAAARDVTESKRLDMVLTEKNIELESARMAADKANQAKSDFLSSMSHEIRSPLNAILGLAYLLEQAKLDLDSNNMVRKIRASGRMLLSLISDILDVSKIEAGQMMIEQAPFRLADVIENLSVVLGVAVGEKDIQLLIRPPPEGVFTLIGDALRLEQVLINLSINAIKFTSVGQVELRTELLSRNSEEIILRFSVRDTGIGISPELQGGVFAAFTQADSATTRRFGGTGLGLTICRQLVNLMGGEIGLSSVLGRGSEFWFTVPLKTVADANSPLSSMALKHSSAIAKRLGWHVVALDSGEALLANVMETKRKRTATVGTTSTLHQPDGQSLLGIRILVVDDSEINCEVAQHILRGKGAIVALAADGQEALDWLQAHPDGIDLVLMDVQMPVMDGIEATRQLRLIPRFADLPIIAMTAGAFKSQQDAAEAAGMTHFISKPFDVPSTIALIQRLYRIPQTVLGAAARMVDTLPSAPIGIAPANDVAAMDVAQGLKIWVDQASYQEYLHRFVDLYSHAVGDIKQSLVHGYRPTAVALAHKLSGVAANLALPEVRRLAALAERVMNTDQDPTVELRQLDAAMESALAEIAHFLHQVNS